ISEAGDKRARPGRRPHSRHNRPSRPPPKAAVRRAAPARRNGPRHRSQPESLSVRRATLEPRCQIARPDAHRDQKNPSEGHDTTVYVTHDQIEAMTLADRVVIMNGGRIDQIGTPHEVYHKPRTQFVAGFIGSP